MKGLGCKITIFSVAFSFILSLLAVPATSFAYSQLKKIRFSSANSKTRIVFDLSGATSFKDSLSQDKKTLNIELKNCRNTCSQKTLKPKKALIKSIQIKKQAKSKLLIQMSLQKMNTTYKIFSLKPFQEKPHRIVVDFSPLKNQPKKNTSVKKTKEKSRKKIIVIDPGHGGQDPGAIGYRGIKEKDVVLKIALQLKKLIDAKIPNTKAYLTRKGDYFIPLHERVKIAQQYQADLFISLHINASKKKYVNGASVYYLSETGATDKASKLLAARENSSDLNAGINLSEDKLLNTILIDLVQTYTINESIRLCQKCMAGLKKVGFHEEGIKCANFAVLRSPSIPSILIELGYVTNRGDAKKINSRKNQKYIASQLISSIKGYFERDKEERQRLTRSKINKNTKSNKKAKVIN